MARLSTGALSAALAVVMVGAVAAPAAARDRGCFGTGSPVSGSSDTVEEARLGSQQVPGALIAAGGFTRFPPRLRATLCSTRSLGAAKQQLKAEGVRLWKTAVARAQGRISMGDIERLDDRPLYWTRLTGTRDIRRWTPRFTLSTAQRDELLQTYEYAARGLASTGFRSGVTRVLVSGFDPYQLDAEIRRSNPSGGAALQLDGAVFVRNGRTVQVQAVALPVTWGGFDAGIVEDAFGPHLAGESRQRADLIMTISQGRRGVMHVERWAAGWRGGVPDNNNEGTPEPVPLAHGWPQPDPAPEWIETTLPHQAMVGAGTGPWPTRLNPQLCEWAAGDRPTGAVTCHDGEPTAGGQASSGGGGSYLSNESMYRSNRLRLALGATDIPGGHLHISALLAFADPAALLDPAFAADRAATIEQTVRLVEAAGAAT
ncbi:hypothetical protein [Actinoplanes derwentensis]|uniref:Pyrrolidone-carboxylate peptidase (N-terminal pyroglutamyl peptidase) n=1 Tax=Actinoplanes derwentensis TaxID=113562 RepID=A0A1H1XC36_9ACTN|nr:hypothetical protein [Actinoplanes derwentensis]GID87133.1 hypothetical protein Ade03nite_60570 [Actinoplanes derwentensis]SDT06888.1 hypothetical protein SAMN04489716_2415 [Actinoplanes derwentensis]